MQNGAHWYAARSKPSQERLALEHLGRQSFHAYYPQVEIQKIRHGKAIRHVEGLFPGYIFVHCALEPAAWRAINGTRGIQRLLSFSEDGRPAQVPDGEIENLQERERKGLFKFSEIQRFRKGDRVRIKNGISVGHTGEVLRTRGERVEFLLSLLGREVRCIAPSHTLDLVALPGVR